MANDVVLAQVVPGLHLDELERSRARVLQPVSRARRDVRRLVRRDGEGLLAPRHPRGAAHHDPVLGAAPVRLEGEPLAGVDDDALHLESVPAVEDIEQAPRTMDHAVVPVLLPSGRREGGDDVPQVLGRALGRDQHRIGGVGNDEVRHPDHRDQPIRPPDVGVAGALEHHVAPRNVSGGVPFAQLGDRRPRPDVGPAGVERDHDGGGGAFHDRVVHRDGRGSGERFRIEPQEAEILLRGAVSRDRCVVDVLRMNAELAQVAVGSEDEHPAVPVVAAVFHERGGSVRVRFLDEPLDPASARTGPGGRPGQDVSVPGFRMRGGDAEGHEPARHGLHQGLPNRIGEPGFVPDDVVDGKDQQDRFIAVARLPKRLKRRRRDRGCRVSRRRLEEHGRGSDADGLELFAHHEAMRFVADHDRRRETRERRVAPDGREAPSRSLQERELVRQREELLGVKLPGKRPEPAAGTSGKDDGDDQAIHEIPCLRTRLNPVRRACQGRGPPGSAGFQPANGARSAALVSLPRAGSPRSQGSRWPIMSESGRGLCVIRTGFRAERRGRIGLRTAVCGHRHQRPEADCRAAASRRAKRGAMARSRSSLTRPLRVM